MVDPGKYLMCIGTTMGRVARALGAMLEADLPLLDCIRSSPTGATRCPRLTGVLELPTIGCVNAVCAGSTDLARPVDAETPDRPQPPKTQFSRRLAARGASVVTSDLPARLEVPPRRLSKKSKNAFRYLSSTAQRCPQGPVASGTIEGEIRSPPVRFRAQATH